MAFSLEISLHIGDSIDTEMKNTRGKERIGTSIDSARKVFNIPRATTSDYRSRRNLLCSTNQL